MRTSRRSFLAGGAAAVVAGLAPRSAWASTQADVIVIGAGLAGLHAAGLLEAAGQRVILIEGSNRIGGRLHTLDDLPGAPEAGGVQVGAGYHRLTAHAARLGIGLNTGGDEPRDALYSINGVTSSGAAWPASAGNRLTDAERAVPPAALGGLYARRLPALASPEAWRDPANIAALDRPYATVLRELGASDEAIRLINANLNGNGVDSISALHIARTAAIFRSQPGPLRTIRGGSQRLPEAMAAALAGDVRLNQRVTAIAEDRGSVTVRLSDGSSLRARQVICTIPFAAMQGVAIEPYRLTPLPDLIPALPYTRATFLYLSAREAFWLGDGGAATLWTDDPLVGRVFALSAEPPLLKVWIAGPSAAAADAMGVDALAAATIARIEAARPAARGQLSLLRHFSWQQQPFARGIYHHIGAGQAAALATASVHRSQLLHFAGEHLAVAASGMEGALESGERAAQAVLGLG
jgi:monoamine oxidase